MTQRLTVTIVGKGSLGSALAANITSVGHEVRVAVRRPELPGQVDLDGASVSGDLTILAVPFDAVGEVVPRLGLAEGSVLVDATNPFGRPLPDGVASGLAVVAAAAGPGVRLVKAFNVLGAEHMASPPLPDGARPVLPVVADDPAALRLVGGLASDMGFEAVEIVGLDNAALLEGAARYWGLLAFGGGLGRDMVLVAHHRRSEAAG